VLRKPHLDVGYGAPSSPAPSRCLVRGRRRGLQRACLWSSLSTFELFFSDRFQTLLEVTSCFWHFHVTCFFEGGRWSLGVARHVRSRVTYVNDFLDRPLVFTWLATFLESRSSAAGIINWKSGYKADSVVELHKDLLFVFSRMRGDACGIRALLIYFVCLKGCRSANTP